MATKVAVKQLYMLKILGEALGKKPILLPFQQDKRVQCYPIVTF
jgi:hypothetical protein